MTPAARCSTTLVWLAFALVWLYPSRPTHAAEGPRYAGIERPRIADPGARLLRETIELECNEVPREFIAAQMECKGQVRWTIELPSGSSATELVFFAEAASFGRIEVNGSDAEVEVAPAPLYDRWWPRFPADTDEGETLLVRSRVAVALPKAERVTVTAHVTLHPRDLWVNHRPLSLAAVRHMVVTPPHDDLQLFFGTTPGASDDSPRRVAEEGSIRVKIPGRWRINRRTWDVSRENGERWLSARPRREGNRLSLSRGEPFPGGPFAAAGISIADKGVRPRLRVGYEMASIPFLMHTLAVESDLRRVEIIASTEAGTANIFVVFPSLSGGVGFPLRVYPTVRPGARVQAALGWPFVSVVGTFDVFPALGAGSLELTGGIMLQLNL